MSMTKERLEQIAARVRLDTKAFYLHADIEELIAHAYKTLGVVEEPKGKMRRFYNGIELFVPPR